MSGSFSQYSGFGGGGGGGVTTVTASLPISSSGGLTPNISISASSGSTNGYLSSTDWNTFNNKQASGNYITALTGDVTATGPGSVAATIANLAVTNAKIANATIDLTAKVTGSLPIANGGTGQTTAPNAINALLPSQTGNNGKYLTTDGSVSSWGTITAGANTALSNLSSVAINASLVPGSNNTLNVGSTAAFWNSGYISSLKDSGNFVSIGVANRTLNDSAGNAIVSFATVNRFNIGAGIGFCLNGSSSGTLTMFAPSSFTNYSMIWPSSNSTGSQLLTNDGAGNLSWTTVAGGSGITALTGDVTATGPGSAAATLATVNANVGTFGSSTSIPTFTVNAKGLMTAASGNAVIAPAGTLTGTTLASNVVTSSLTTIGTIGTGTWQGSVVSPVYGGTGIANNVASTLTISGNFGTTLTVGATTSLTLPSTGTLATLAGSETFTSKTFGDEITNTQIATPSNPAASKNKLYFKSDNILYSLSNAGVETQYVTSITSYVWSGYHADTALISTQAWTNTNSSYADFTNNSSTITFTEVINSNFGLVSSYGGVGALALPGIVFSPPVTGLYFVKASFSIDGVTGGHVMGVRLRESLGSTTIDGAAQNFATAQTMFPTTLSGIFNATSTASTTISIEGCVDPAATLAITGTYLTGSRAIEWTIYKI